MRSLAGRRPATTAVSCIVSREVDRSAWMTGSRADGGHEGFIYGSIGAMARSVCEMRDCSSS